MCWGRGPLTSRTYYTRGGHLVTSSLSPPLFSAPCHTQPFISSSKPPSVGFLMYLGTVKGPGECHLLAGVRGRETGRAVCRTRGRRVCGQLDASGWASCGGGEGAVRVGHAPGPREELRRLQTLDMCDLEVALLNLETCDLQCSTATGRPQESAVFENRWTVGMPWEHGATSAAWVGPRASAGGAGWCPWKVINSSLRRPEDTGRAGGHGPSSFSTVAPSGDGSTCCQPPCGDPGCYPPLGHRWDVGVRV